MDGIFIGMGGGKPQAIDLKRANRHGLIAGATGTGKTVTLQTMVEGFSRAGVPSFVADVKGDLAGLGMAGSAMAKTHAAFAARAAELGMTDWSYDATPVQFWDLFGQQGHPVRATVSEMGPLLLARMMGLNETQEGVLTIAFHVADKEGLQLLDLDDLQAMLTECAARANELTTTYGNVSKQSIGAIQRALLQLRTQGAEHFFGEPALELTDLIATDDAGRGVVNILAADQLMASPKLYATFLLWLLSELFEQLPEIGDPDKPKLVFFFDEAHLLFDDAAPALVDTIERVVRLIRSKGVGVYFITQNPIDVPDKIAGQLGNRVQHALRAFTPRDQAAVRSAATSAAAPGSWTGSAPRLRARSARAISAGRSRMSRWARPVSVTTRRASPIGVGCTANAASVMAPSSRAAPLRPARGDDAGDGRRRQAPGEEPPIVRRVGNSAKLGGA